MPQEIEIRLDPARAPQPFPVWGWVSLAIFTVIGVSGVIRLVPFAGGVDLNLLYAHVFIVVAAMRARMPVWAYFAAGLFHDFIIASGAGISALILTVLYLGLARVARWSAGQGFWTLWCLYALVMLGVLVARSFGAVLFARGVSFDGAMEFLAVHVLLFPFAYGLLLPLKSRPE